ncbi:MAG TPA: phosphate acyltransferase, partial [Bacteroidota bacterium]|nr:phosphate acyltransferase [Bacteroidota bacterium]
MDPKNLMTEIHSKAKSLKKTIVLPDAKDERAIQAARILVDQGLAVPVLIGDTRTIEEGMKKTGTSPDGIQIIDPSRSDRLESFAGKFYELRKAKGL